MQAIKTKYLGPTETKGSRVKASCAAGSWTMSWDHGLTIAQNHAEAAKSLIKKLGWGSYGNWHTGQLQEGPCVWVCDYSNTKLDHAGLSISDLHRE